MTMTKREVLNNVANGVVNDEVMAWAVKQIELMDKANAKRAEKPSKMAIANAPLKEAIYNYLCENEGKYTEAELGAVIETSHNKAGSLVRQLVAEGKVNVEEVKLPKIGKRKAYFVTR